MTKTEKLFAILETVVIETRQWIPHGGIGPFHSANEGLAPEIRTKLAFLEDNLKKATSIVGIGEGFSTLPRIQNPECCGSHCTSETGEVRVLRLGPSSDHGNLILCRSCYAYEMEYRKERNKKLSADCQFELPQWESLVIYSQ